MYFIAYCYLSIFSFLVVLILYFGARFQKDEELFQSKLFLAILQITMFLVIVNFLGRFDGKPDTIYPIINRVGNFLLFLFNPVLPSLWFLYSHFQVHYNESRTKKLIFPLLGITLFNAVIIILTQFNGWAYYFDSGNIYHRGILFFIPAAINVVLLLAALIFIIINRKIIENKYFYSLAFFGIPPLICMILQIIFYGIDIVLNSIVLSLLIIYVNIQNRKMSIDYLTGAFNRKQLDIYIDNKIRSSNKNNAFSAVLIDLDDFKKINDNYGHDMGDDALITSVKILKQNAGKHGFIARFGGDEFYAVFDIKDITALEKKIFKINACIDDFNTEKSKPYKLGFSMGYLIYDYKSGMNAEDFFKQIDNLMYENKRAKKEQANFIIS